MRIVAFFALTLFHSCGILLVAFITGCKITKQLENGLGRAKKTTTDDYFQFLNANSQLKLVPLPMHVTDEGNTPTFTRFRGVFRNSVHDFLLLGVGKPTT